MESITKSLSTGSHSEVFNVLLKQPIDDISFVESIDLFAKVLNECAKMKCSPSILKVVLNRWRKCLNAGDLNDTVGHIAGLADVKPDTLRYILTCLPSIKIDTILKSHITTETGISFGMMYDRLENIGLRVPVWEEYYDMAINCERKDIIDFIADKAGLEEHNAEMPSWVSRKPGDKETDWKEYKASVPTTDRVESIISDLTEQVQLGTSDDKVVPTDVLEQVVQMALSSDEKKHAAADPDRIFGPVNPILNQECDESIPGGCRMLSCTCREVDQDIDDDTPSPWFTGECDTCKLTIRNLSHAIRQPVVGGGWIGCYCSIQCLRDNPARSLDQMAELLLDHMITIIEDKGISDRS